MTGKLVGLVLAGGHSLRMGQDKSRLNWQGQPLYQHMVSLLGRAGIDRVLLSGSGFSSGVADILPGKGPLSGIHAAFAELEDDDRLFVIPVDMPLLPVKAIRWLCTEPSCCCFEGYNLPVLLALTRETRMLLERAIRSENPKDFALWRWYRQIGVKTLSLPASMEEKFINVNTPKDWQTLITFDDL